MLLTALQVNAVVKSQETLLNVNVARVSLVEVLKMIESKSDYTCLYSHEDVAKVDNLTVELKNVTVQEILDVCLKGTRLGYKIVDQTIVIRNLSEMEQKNGEAKQRTITGRVTDKSGVPLPGVTVMIKGLSVGTATDVNGDYKLAIPQGEKDFVLQFSFVGMKTQEVKYVGKDTINVVLEEEVNTMDEVVITGYQRIDKRKNASSVISVKGSELQEGAAISIDNMLQGKLAGVNIINPTSTPGAAPKVRIRGASSISGNREPVWVVDGIILEDPVPISAEELNSLDNVNLIGNAIASINPEDIDRIDVLKDASATAIYGVKAANGVIVITTKKGKYGKPTVHYSGNVGISLRPSYNNLNRMNSKERIDVSKEIEERGLTFGIKPSNIGYEGALYDLYAKRITQEQFVDRVYDLEKVNTDWYDELFRTDVSHKHSLSISGGSEFVNYYFSAGYANTNAVVKGSDVENYNALLKLNLELSKRLNVGLSLRAYAATKKYLHGSIDPYGYAYNTSRAIPAYNKDGSYLFYNKTEGYETILNYNILNERDNTGRKIKNQTIDFMVDVNYKILSGLTFSGVFSLSKANTKDSEWANEKSYYITDLRGVNYGDELPTDRNFVETRCRLPYGGELKNDNTLSSTYTVRAGFNYFKRLHEVHEIDVNVGTEARSVKYDGISTVQRGYLPDRGKKFVAINATEWPLYNEWLMANPDVVVDRLTNVVSFYGTFTYTYDDRYTANFNIRTDGSNKFGQDKSTKFLPVWSAAVRWNIHNEMFFSNIQWMNLLALKGSYGVQGNVHSDQTPNLIVSMSGMDDVSKEYISSLNKLQNPYLKWEKTKSWNVAVDFALFDGRVKGGFDIYRKNTSDLIMSKQVAASTGQNVLYYNAGKMVNKGFEGFVNLGLVNNRDWDWRFGFNFGRNVNEITLANRDDLSEASVVDQMLAGTLAVEGQPIGSMYAYRFAGLNQDNGYPLFYSKNGQKVHRALRQDLELVHCGSIFPKLSGGFDTQVIFKKVLSLSLNFAYSTGSVSRLPKFYDSYTIDPLTNLSDEWLKCWKQAGDNTIYPAPYNSTDMNNYLGTETGSVYDISEGISGYSNPYRLYNDSDIRVAKADFLKLKMVALSYSVPQNVLDFLHVSSMLVRFQVMNLFTIADKKWKGLDPETNGANIPALPTYSFGINVSF